MQTMLMPLWIVTLKTFEYLFKKKNKSNNNFPRAVTFNNTVTCECDSAELFSTYFFSVYSSENVDLE